MSNFRMGGVPPGALCPTCSYPHFPFCVRHPANGSALPPPMPGSFPSPLPSRAPGHPPIHSPQLPSHLPLLGPSGMTSYQPSPPLLQSFPGRGVIGDAAPNGGGVPLIGRGANASKGLLVHSGQHPVRSMDGAMNSDSIQFGGCPFPTQSLEPFQNPLPPHMSNSRLSTPPTHLPNSVEHFPGPLNPPALSGSPHSGLLANSIPPPGNAWAEEKERDNLLREKSPSMPQWFLDQQRRSGSKGVPPNGRSGIGELLRLEEIVQGPIFSSEVAGARVMNQGRLERDRQGVFENKDVLEAQRAQCRFREDMPSKFPDRDGPFPGMDMSGNGVLTESGAELVPPGLWDRFEGVRDGVADRERRLWGLDTSRDSSVEQGFSSHNSRHAGYLDQRRGSAAPSFARNAGGGKYQMGRKERGGEGMWSQQSSREEQLLHEHGLVDDSVQGMTTSSIVSLGEGEEEHWEGHGHVPGRGHFLREGPDGTAQRRLHTEGDQMGTAHGTELSTPYHSRQQIRPVSAYKLHGSGNLVRPARSPVNGERQYFDSSRSGVGLRGPATNADTSHFGRQSDDNSNAPPVQEELDELYYLKHFPQPNDDQVSSCHQSVAPSVRTNQAGMKDDGPFQENLQLVASQKWANEQRPPGVQLTGHVQQSDRGHPQQPAQPHQRNRSPQAHGRQPSHLTSRNSFQQDAQLPDQSYPQHQAGALHVQNRQSEVSKQPAAAQPSQTKQISNGQQAIQSSQPAQMQYQDRHHQHERLHHASHLMQTQVSDLAHQHMKPLPQSQGPLLPHQMQQQGQGGQLHPSRFYHPAPGMYQSFTSEGVSVNGRTIESLSTTSQASVAPSLAHQHPAPSLDAPPLPLNAADAPPPPPPSPPYCQPPRHSPPMASPPPPPPLAPPLPPSPPPLLSSALTHVPTVSFSATFPGHPHPLNVEEPLQRLNYLHPTHALPQSLPVVPQGPGFQSMGPRYMPQFGEFRNQGQLFPQQLLQPQDRAKVVDAVSVFRRPGRLTRPDRIVVILRGLPGSGKSYLAKALRDVELMNGGNAPRIHSIDDYFMTEVEKVEGEEAGLTTSSSVRTKKRATKKVMEYCFEPEMEEVYRGSMLKAFRKTLEEGMFSFIIVDDRNVLVADFAQFWAIAKRSGYEVYLLEPPYKDPAGCAARNVHNFKQGQIQDMAKRWEPAPPMYLQLDISSLFRGDDLNAQDITEVEMDTDDMEREGDDQEEEYQSIERRLSRLERSEEDDGKPATPGDRWEDSDGEAEEPVKPAKRMRFNEVPKSKSDSSGSSGAHGPGNNALSGLMQAYGKREKSVRWADHQDEKDDKGLSIGSALEKISDLVIGPGPGYNKVSNPVRTEDCRLHDENVHLDQSRKFLEQYRAEQDAFKAVFAIRRQGGPGVDDEDGVV